MYRGRVLKGSIYICEGVFGVGGTLVPTAESLSSFCL